MSRIEQALRELRPEWPETPDVWPAVEAELSTQRRPSHPWIAIAAVVLAVLAVGAGLTRAVPVVADGLGIGSVAIKFGPIEAVGDELRLGEAVAGNPGVVQPAVLGPPDAVYVDGPITWLVYRPRPDLPEVLTSGVGALVAEIEGDGLLEKVIDPTVTDRIDVMVDGLPAVWLEGGEHELLVRRGDDTVVSSRGRLAGNTLVWERDGTTYRLEVALPVAAAVLIAESMEP